MVISFKLSRRGRRFYPTPTASTATADDPPPPTASPDGPRPMPPRPPPLPWDAAAARLDGGIAARSDVPDGNGTDPVDLDLEPSFALNLFPDGYSIGEPGKGMLLFLIGDDPEKQPYNRASKALLSDIEHGCLPQDILHDTPCRFLNGTIVCEVRDYRSFLSNGGDSSEDDFPKMNRVALRLDTECVVKDLSSIVDASWTYHDLLIAESTILNALQPRLNLDPTPCLERLCNSVVKKIDLGVNKGSRQTKDTSLLNISTDPPENCKPKECNTCEGAAVCIENAGLEVLPSGILNSSSVNCSSSLQINIAKSAVGSDLDNTIQHSSTLRKSSALCERKQSSSSIPTPDHLLQNHEQPAQAAIIQVDRKNGQSRRETVLPQKRKDSSNLPCQMHEHQNVRPLNKNTRLGSPSSRGQFQKSMGAPNKEGLKLGSPKEPHVEVKVDQTVGNNNMRVQRQKALLILSTNRPLSSLKGKPHSEVKVDQTVGSKNMRVQQQKALSILPANRPLLSLKGNNPCLEKIPEKVKLGPAEVKVDQTIGKKDMRGKQQEPLRMLPTNRPHPYISNPCVEKNPGKVNTSHTRMKDRHQASVLDLDNYGVAELGDSRTPSVTSCNASSRKAACKPPHEDKAATKTQPTSSKRKVSGTCTVSLNQKTNLKGKKQKKADIRIKRPCENRSSLEPGVTDGSGSQLDISPDIELCIGHPLYAIEPDIEKILSEVILTTERHGLNGKAAKIDGLETSRPSSSCSLYQFFPFESAEGSPYVREDIISCYPTGISKNTRNIRRLVFHRVQYFCRGTVDQSHYVISLIESEAPDDHQIAVETIFGDEHVHIATFPNSHHANKFVDQFIHLMKRDGYTLCNATVCNGLSEFRQQFEDVSHLGHLTGEYSQYQGFSPCVAKSVVIKECKDADCAFQKRLPNAHADVLQQGSQQWIPTEHSPALASFETFHFLNPGHSVEQQYTSRVLRDQGLPFASGVCSMDLDQYLSVEPSEEGYMDQYFQCRHDIPGFSERYATNTSTGSYDHWHQIPTQVDSRLCHLDSPAFRRLTSDCPPLPVGSSILLSGLHPVGTPPMSSQTIGSNFCSVPGTTVNLPLPLSYQHLSHGMC